MKYALALEYIGTDYKGWQAQPGLRTVQSELENALSQIANEKIDVVCAGRTDAGVHAMKQIVHFETNVEREVYNWILGANTILPETISIKWVQPVLDDFHARFSATARRYRYYILNQRARSAIYHERMAWQCFPLDHQAMHEAAQTLIGEHDFSAFRGADCQSHTPMRNIVFIKVTRQDAVICVDIQANAFLHHMVRNIVGSLFAIGEGKQDASWLKSVLDGKVRAKAGPTAPACGLYMVDILYPEKYALPKEPLLEGVYYE